MSFKLEDIAACPAKGMLTKANDRRMIRLCWRDKPSGGRCRRAANEDESNTLGLCVRQLRADAGVVVDAARIERASRSVGSGSTISPGSRCGRVHHSRPEAMVAAPRHTAAAAPQLTAPVDL